MRYRTYGVIGTIFLVILVGVLFYRAHQNSFQTITIKVSSPTQTVTLYAPTNGDESTNYDTSKTFIAATKQGTYRLKKSTYVYVVKDTSEKDYQEFSKGILLDDKPLTITAPKLMYTESKLASLLSSESAAAQLAINTQYPYVAGRYTIQNEKLYKQGQWYAAKLVPVNVEKYDTLGIVLTKSGGEWKLVTKPPAIIVSHPVYPEIPEDILTDINNFN